MRDIGCLTPMWTHRPFPYTSEEPHIAATLCAAGLQVSRKIQLLELELHIFNLMTRASELVTGWRMGRELLAGAGKSNGAAFASNWAFCRGWGLGPEATPARYIQALKDLKDFRAGLHSAAWEIGAWPVFLAGTQTAMSLCPTINCLYIFCRPLPQSCEFRRDQEVTFSDNEDAEAKKRKREKAGSEGSGPPKEVVS